MLYLYLFCFQLRLEMILCEASVNMATHTYLRNQNSTTVQRTVDASIIRTHTYGVRREVAEDPSDRAVSGRYARSSLQVKNVAANASLLGELKFMCNLRSS